MSASDPLRAILLGYGGLHFLINREQCEASRFIPESRKPAARNRYLRESLRVGDARMLLFDLDLFLVETFRVRSDAAARLAIVVGIASLGEGTRALLGRAVFPRLEAYRLATDRIAFRVPSDSVTTTLDIGELEPIRGSVRKPLLRRGVLALHLVEGSMGFLLDLDRLVGSGSLFAGKTQEGAMP